MPSFILWSLLVLAVICYLAYDLKTAWYYRNITESDIETWPFLGWWIWTNLFKLSFLGGTVAIIGVALFMQEYTLALPNMAEWWKVAPGAVRWGVLAALIVFAIMAMDLSLAWWSYRNQQDWSDGESSFFRWLVKKKTVEFCALVGVVCLFWGGGWGVRHFRLLEVNHETSGYSESAKLYYKQEKYREATLELRNAIGKNQGDYEAHLWLGRSQWQLGNFPEARMAYREAIRIQPKLYEATVELGRLCLVMGEKVAALKIAEDAVGRDPRVRGPHLLLADVYLAMNKEESALGQYRVVVGNDPADQETRKLLINLLTQRREYAEAGREIESGLKGNPEDTGLKVSLALMRNGEGRWKEAESILTDAATRESVSPLPLITLGDLYIVHQEYMAALPCYEKALKLAPHDAVVMNNVASLHAEHGYDMNRAAELAYQLYAKNPRDPAAADTLGWVFFKQGKVEQAMSLLRLAATGAPQVPEIRYHYGAALLKGGSQAEGKRELAAALKISGNFDGNAKARRLLQVR